MVTKRHWWIAGSVALLGVGIAVWMVRPSDPAIEPEEVAESALPVDASNSDRIEEDLAAAVETAIDETKIQVHAVGDFRLERQSDGRVFFKPSIESAQQLNRSNYPEDSIRVVQQLLNHYRFAYKENPVGVENFEITEQLVGENPMQIVFVAPGNPGLVGNELVDEWGTPFFFHAVSSQQMDVRSAGPDRELWTADDIFIE
ncbi:MAG: hypothetical protein AAFX93_06525 [Verrucomicrobiota bacterium]